MNSLGFSLSLVGHMFFLLSSASLLLYDTHSQFVPFYCWLSTINYGAITLNKMTSKVHPGDDCFTNEARINSKLAECMQKNCIKRNPRLHKNWSYALKCDFYWQLSHIHTGMLAQTCMLLSLFKVMTEVKSHYQMFSGSTCIISTAKF